MVKPSANRLSRNFSGALFLALLLGWEGALLAGPPAARLDPPPTPTFIPFSINEEELTGEAAVVSDGVTLDLEAVRQLLAEGQAEATIAMAERALSAGGAPLAAIQWRALKAEALFQLQRHPEVIAILEGLGQENLRREPGLLLLLADSYMRTKRFGEAKGVYSRFILDYPRHPENMRVEKGLGLALLGMGELEAAELHLGLYSVDKKLLEQDAEFLVGMADLSLRRGMYKEVANHLKKVARLPVRLPREFEVRREYALYLMREKRFTEAGTELAAVLGFAQLDPETRKQSRRDLVTLEASSGHWLQAITQAELLLREEPGRATLELHAQLYRDWLKVETKWKTPPRDLVEMGIRQRRELLLGVLGGEDTTDPLSGEQYLRCLLEREVGEGLGILHEGGLLYPAGLGYPTIPDSWRLAYAQAYRELGWHQEAARMLEGTHGEAAMIERLLLVIGQEGKNSLVVADAVEAIIAVCRRSWTPGLIAGVTEAMFELTSRDEPELASRLRELLGTLKEHVGAARAARFQQGMARERAGDLEGALAIYLELTQQGGTGEEWWQLTNDSLLPEVPRLAAARILERKGATAEAMALRSGR